MPSLNNFIKKNARIVAFTGKGGVGKTTCASATALHFAHQGERVLLLSSDRSPSLSDILGTDVHGEITDIPRVDGLDAVEMDYEVIADLWKERYGEEVYQVVSSFISVDRDVIDYFAHAPGIPEEFALSYILDLYRGEKYDRLIWDTAPAGSTVFLLQLQEDLYSHLGQVVKFYSRFTSLVKGKIENPPAELIEKWKKLAQDCLEMVRSPKTEFITVSIPETLSLRETDRLVEELRDRDLRIGAIVVNNLIQEDSCNCQFHRKRAKLHKKNFEILKRRYSKDPGLVAVPQFPGEVQGIKGVNAVARELFGYPTR